MTLVEIMALAGAGAAAGMVNAVAGGGTLLSFPALLAFGTPAVVANATSTMALVIGTAGSVFGYRRQIAAAWPWVRRFLPVSLAGGLLGALLLTRTGEKTFSSMVPFLLLFATLVFLGQGAFRRLARLETAGERVSLPTRGALWAGMFFQFLVSLYGGYFGAGIGILMLASLGCLGLSDIHQMNGVKTMLGTLINLVAALYFAAAGLVHWPKAGVMTAGALAGYFAGAHFAQRIPQKHVRRIIAGVGLAISAWLFCKQLT